MLKIKEPFFPNDFISFHAAALFVAHTWQCIFQDTSVIHPLHLFWKWQKYILKIKIYKDGPKSLNL